MTNFRDKSKAPLECDECKNDTFEYLGIRKTAFGVIFRMWKCKKCKAIWVI